MAEQNLYLAKINCDSHNLKLYDDYERVRFLSRIKDSITSGVEYKREDFKKIDGEEKKTYEGLYSFDFIEKFDKEHPNAVFGRVLKKGKLFHRVKNSNDELVWDFVENYESISFYFDTRNELVTFHARQRFGESDFLKVFPKLIEESFKKDSFTEYEFSGEFIKREISRDQLIQNIKNLDGVKKLEIKIKAPNPDDEIFSANQFELDSYIKSEFVDFNATQKEITYSTNSPEGLNLNSLKLEETIDNISKIRDNIPEDIDEKISQAFKKRHASLTTTSVHGKVYTTDSRENVRQKVDSDILDNFGKFIMIAKRFILENR